MSAPRRERDPQMRLPLPNAINDLLGEQRPRLGGWHGYGLGQLERFHYRYLGSWNIT